MSEASCSQFSRMPNARPASVSTRGSFSSVPTESGGLAPGVPVETDGAERQIDEISAHQVGRGQILRHRVVT